MIQFRRIFFEDVYEYIDKERREDGLFRAKQQKLAVISVMKIFVMHGFYLFVFKNLAPNLGFMSLIS